MRIKWIEQKRNLALDSGFTTPSRLCHEVPLYFVFIIHKFKVSFAIIFIRYFILFTSIYKSIVHDGNLFVHQAIITCPEYRVPLLLQQYHHICFIR